MLEQPGLNVGYLAYNTQKKPFDDVRVRKAVNMAINKRRSSTRSTWATGVAAKNPIPPTQWSYNDAIKDDRSIRRRREEAAGGRGLPERDSAPTCGPCRCSARTTPTRSASPS